MSSERITQINMRLEEIATLTGRIAVEQDGQKNTHEGDAEIAKLLREQEQLIEELGRLVDETPRSRLWRAINDAHPVPLGNLYAPDFGLRDLDELVAMLDDLRADGLVDYRMASFTGYDRVREAWLLT